MKNKVKILGIIGIFILVLIVVKKQYLLFPQAEFLYSSGVKIRDLIYQKNVHFFRYMVVYLPIIFTDVFKINLNLAYTIYIYIVGGILILFSSKIFLIKTGGKKISLIYVLAFYLLIYLTVNGRILFAYLGEVILIYEIYCEKNRKKIYLFCIFLASVSSGTMLVIIFSLLIYLMKINKIKKLFSKNGVIVLIAILPVLIYANKMILKNLYFYEGNIFKVLEHGIFTSDNFELTLILSCLYAITILLCGFILKIKKDINKSLLFISLLFGLFGKTTFAMSLIPFFFEIGFYLNKIKWRIKINVEDNN